MAQSQAFQKTLEPYPGRTIKLLDSVVLHPLVKFKPTRLSGPGVLLDGRVNIPLFTFEAANLERAHQEDLAAYPLRIVCSNWNKETLDRYQLGPSVCIHQGVDPSAFFPAPGVGLLRGKFCVFSGGKLEYRKGHDLVLLAFKAFASRHPDATLVTAWHSPWAVLASGIARGGNAKAPPLKADGSIDVVGWAVANGIRPEQVMDIGTIPNAQMPRVLREMDVALFPNRCEAGTNMVAMESMACGLPTILSANCGHFDLIQEANCYPLMRQAPIEGRAYDQWGESDVDEMVEALERVYTNRAEAQWRGARGAQTIMDEFTWERNARGIAQALAGFL